MDPYQQYLQSTQQAQASQHPQAQPSVSRQPQADAGYLPGAIPQTPVAARNPKAIPISQLTVDKQIKLVRDFLSKTLDSTNERGEPDLRKIVYNGTYNMGSAAIEIAGLVMQEKRKLEKITAKYRVKKAKVLERLRNTRLGWGPSQGEIQTMVDGNTQINIDGEFEDNHDDDESLTRLKSKMENQQNYIDFLKDAQECIRYYCRNGKALVDVYQFGMEIGKIIPAENDWDEYK